MLSLILLILISAVFVSYAEAGIVKGIWIEVLVVSGAILYGLTVNINFEYGRPLWLIHPALLASIWNTINIVFTMVLFYIASGIHISKLPFRTWFLSIIFTVLASVLFTIGVTLQRSIENIISD